MTGLATSRVFVSSTNETYSYDGAGNLVSTTYSGDTHGRLATMTGTTGVSPVGGGNTGTTGVSPVPSNTFAYSYLPGTDDFDNSNSGGFAELEVSAVVSDGTNDFVSVATNRVFVPPANETYAYDADGNQTLVTTGTGAWQVEYNGENRPVRWTYGDKTILMTFDHRGRRRLYVEVTAGVTNKLHRFTYDDYVCIARNREVDAQHGIGSDAFVWDPTEPIATRPLMCDLSGDGALFYCHDGNKNVSEIVSLYGTITAHYEYSSFGKVVLVTSENEDQSTANLNPYRFSSEYADDATRLVYYNYRHYEPVMGRWMSRDALGEFDHVNPMLFVRNAPSAFADYLGLWSSWKYDDHQSMVEEAIASLADIDCLQNPSTREKVTDYLKWANAGMDFSENYNQEGPIQLPYHYNRAVLQDEAEAIQRFTDFMKKQREYIDNAIGAKTRAGCDSALKELGKLSHSVQDYYGHGVSRDYGKSIRRRSASRRRTIPKHGIGKMKGSPDSPAMSPSSYGWYGLIGNHGFILFPEPGTRAPDTDERKKAAIKDTKELFGKYLKEWCKACGDCPPEKRSGNRKYPSGSDYGEDF